MRGRLFLVWLPIIALSLFLAPGLFDRPRAQEGSGASPIKRNRMKAVVLDLSAKRVEGSLAMRLSALLRQTLHDDIRLELLSGESTKRQLASMAQAKGLRPEDCDHSRCLAEIGQGLGVERVVSGMLDNLEGSCYIALSLTNVLSKQEDGFVREYCSCDEDGFRAALETAAKKLVSYARIPYLPPSPLTGTLLVAPTSTPRPFQGGLEGMIFIPAGDFFMGHDRAKADEKPVHWVFLEPYYIDPYEVTNAQYDRFEKESGYQSRGRWRDYFGSGRESHPVAGMTWEDANAYCQWAGKRLPTEAEWEKAARGAAKLLWPWGNVFEPKRANSAEEHVRATLPVGSYEGGKSPYQLYDMAGNVAEWCVDWYGDRYYGDSPPSNPPGPPSGKLKVLRGGAFMHDKSKVTTTARLTMAPDEHAAYVGFRCARSGTSSAP